MMHRLSLLALVAVTSACAARSPSMDAATSATAVAPASASDTGAEQAGAVQQASGAAAKADVSSASSAPVRRKTTGPITADELAHESIANGDAYSAVQKLRPSFLTTRGSVSLRGGGGGVLVSIDRAPPTSLSALRSMRANEILEVKYLSASEAGQQFGTAARNGAVLVVTRR